MNQFTFSNKYAINQRLNTFRLKSSEIAIGQIRRDLLFLLYKDPKVIQEHQFMTENFFFKIFPTLLQIHSFVDSTVRATAQFEYEYTVLMRIYTSLKATFFSITKFKIPLLYSFSKSKSIVKLLQVNEKIHLLIFFYHYNPYTFKRI